MTAYYKEENCPLIINTMNDLYRSKAPIVEIIILIAIAIIVCL